MKVERAIQVLADLLTDTRPLESLLAESLSQHAVVIVEHIQRIEKLNQNNLNIIFFCDSEEAITTGYHTT